MLNNVMRYWAYIRGTYIWGAYIRVGLYLGGGGPYIWNEVSVSICGGLIFGGRAYIRGAYSRRFTVAQSPGGEPLHIPIIQ
jgi:hypothetical protein